MCNAVKRLIHRHANQFSDFLGKPCPNRPADSLRCLLMTAVPRSFTDSNSFALQGTACPPFLEDALPFCPFGTFPHTVGNHPRRAEPARPQSPAAWHLHHPLKMDFRGIKLTYLNYIILPYFFVQKNKKQQNAKNLSFCCFFLFVFAYPTQINSDVKAVRFWQPSSVMATKSSIRTPNSPGR